MLVERFRKYPKPMYYQPAFLDAKWAEYKELNKISNDDDVVPDDFAVWGFEQLLHHRIPLYQQDCEELWLHDSNGRHPEHQVRGRFRRPRSRRHRQDADRHAHPNSQRPARPPHP